MASDPIAEAKTVASFIAAVDKKYGLDLPTSFDGGDLAAIWQSKIKVQKEEPPQEVVYKARGEGKLQITMPAGKVCLSVVAPREQEKKK